ncbi:MAG: host attachment protein [Salinisphaera sp.]|jgi:protein required for attachment to host cells|nr:host attachment protein [Salinisphaera sp.]
MTTTWIVVADAAEARIFSRVRAGKSLDQVDTLHHDESKAHEGDLRTGGKGEVADSSGHGRHQADPQTSTGEKHADIFAKQVMERLKTGLNDKAFDWLVIAAAPAFLGHLRDKLDSPLTQAVQATIDKNWVQEDDRQLEKLIEKHLG